MYLNIYVHIFGYSSKLISTFIFASKLLPFKIRCKLCKLTRFKAVALMRFQVISISKVYLTAPN